MAHIELHEPVISPIQAMPPELLRIIFLEACKTLYGPSALDMRTFPWVAGEVCHRWREMVLELPQMWNNLKLIIRPRIPLPSNSAHILHEHLLRTKYSPLTVDIVYPNESYDPNVPKVLTVICARSEQWRSASLVIHYTILAEFFSRINGHLSRLETLRWSGLPYLGFIVAPNLRNLDLQIASCTHWFPQWAQLQRITLHDTLAFSELEVLQASDQLQELHLIAQFFFFSPPTIKLSNLRVLKCFPMHLDLFLELPKLAELDLTGTRDDLMSTTAFIQRISPRLISLKLPFLADDYDPSVIVDIFNMSPVLERLNMRCLAGAMWNAAMDFLEIHPEQLDESVHLLELKHIDVWSRTEVETYRCIEMIESRFSNSRRFKSINWCRMPGKDFPQGVEMRLERLGHRGLKIY
ncbi:hypothetical protein C8J56DRAFT_917331 [Mycena floridula]|nr:hypothetical protein C8J56DRAFT_917331 [Mycena floridula]